MVNPDNLPMFKESKRPLKFGLKTKQYSIRIPPPTIEKIKKMKLDVSRMVYDVVEGGLDPYSSNGAVFEGLCHKLIGLMIAHKIDATDIEFLPEERALIMKIAKEVQG